MKKIKYIINKMYSNNDINYKKKRNNNFCTP